MACPKGLRRGFGMRAAGYSIPINLIQRWMGHASPVTTAIYLDAVGLEERNFASRMR
jgi:integrase/recombinase XerD